MKTILILGALSDIAQATAHHFAQRGWRLQLAARRAARLEPLAQDLRLRHSSAVETYEFDITDLASHPAFYTGLATKPDVALCVAGYLGDAAQARQDAAESRQIVATNFDGPVSILDIVAEDFEKRRSGCIVGISSVAGERGRQSNYHYGAAKAGFTAYLSGLRNRLYATGVHVATIKPGFVRTRMTENVKLPPLVTATPDEVAAATYRAVGSRSDVVYVRAVWRWIMFMIRSIPESIFKKMRM